MSKISKDEQFYIVSKKISDIFGEYLNDYSENERANFKFAIYIGLLVAEIYYYLPKNLHTKVLIGIAKTIKYCLDEIDVKQKEKN